MAIKKSDLYSSLWKMCDELRGGMDASQYKDYVLVLLFVKYVSDKYAGQKKALISVPEGGGFADMVALAGNKEIGDKVNKIIAKLAEANGLRGVIDVADFNDEDKLGKGDEMVQRLSKLVKIFDDANLDYAPNTATATEREAVLERWYRSKLKTEVEALFTKWQEIIGVQPTSWGIRRMKTKWGSCNTQSKRIWLNLELAKKPLECIEYIVVHELAHLIERHHNDRFIAIMDKHLPQWRSLRKLLNSAPLKHEDWEY